MEKEIQIELATLHLNYLGDEFERLEESLGSLAKVFESFLKGDLGLSGSHFTINISLCSSERIIELNTDYRNKTSETDVLSFPVQENIREGDFDKFLPELELGDIFICEGVCADQAKEFKIDFREEFIHLAVHGFLHLCGYDHEISDNEEELMESLEQRLIVGITQLK